MYYTRFHTTLCEICLVGNEKGLTHLHLNTGEGKRQFEISKEWVHNHDFFAETIKRVNDYIDGKTHHIDALLNPQGTEFQKKVWHALQQIPYGQVRTYRDIAEAIGNANSARAVGMANSKNPIPLIIPCHRVIGTNGKLTGFAHGLKIKDQLIKLESQPTT